MHRVLDLSQDKNLNDFSFFLYRHGIYHKVSEESGKLVLWAEDVSQVDFIRELYRQWSSGNILVEQAPPRKGFDMLGMFRGFAWQKMPVTMLTILLCIIVATFTRLGGDWAIIKSLTFVPFEVSGKYIYFGDLSLAVKEGEYWRFLTPIFLHFSFAHLSFNMLALYIFGSHLEGRMGELHMSIIIVVSGLLSNFAQYFWSGNESLFGGFSGVIYGLVGYSLVREIISETRRYGLPIMYYGAMVVWLLIGYTGILTVLGIGNIANASHTGGLITGCLLGVLAAVIFRQNQTSINSKG